MCWLTAGLGRRGCELAGGSELIGVPDPSLVAKQVCFDWAAGRVDETRHSAAALARRPRAVLSYGSLPAGKNGAIFGEGQRPEAGFGPSGPDDQYCDSKDCAEHPGEVVFVVEG